MTRDYNLFLPILGVSLLAIASPVLAEADSRRPIIFEADVSPWFSPAGQGKSQAGETVTAGLPAQPVTSRKDSRKTSSAAEVPSGLKASIARHAAAHGIPVALAQAVIKVESRFNPRASNAGNYGLMQIRHQTARGVGYTGSTAGLLDAETNLRYGMAYLAQAYRAAGGETCGTIMRYQSGLGATRMSGANRAYCSKVRSYVAQG
jgi:soluble lytic murein transglycosylase-like protein